MRAVSSRPTTPSLSPRHSRPPQHSDPVPIPPAPSTDLHHANALRHRHLYGYTEPSASASSFLSRDSESTCSEAEYEDFVVDTSKHEIVVDERGWSSIPETDTQSSSTGSLSISAAVFPPSTAPAVPPVEESFGNKVLIENVEQVPDWEDQALTPCITLGDADTNNIAPITDDFSLGTVDFPPILPGLAPSANTANSRPNSVRPTAVHAANDTRHQGTASSSRSGSATSGKAKALAHLDDEFQCMTCHHAGVCADLVMKDPNFRCGDTITGGARARDSSAGESDGKHSGGAGEKTPWTVRTLKGIGLGKQPSRVEDEKERNKLRVLDGGIDYVHYDEADESEESGGGSRLLDMEDIGRAIRATTRSDQDNRKTAPPDNTATGSSLSPKLQVSTRKTGAQRPARQSWTDVKVERPASTTTTLYDSSSDASSFGHDILSVCADTKVHLEPAILTTDTESDLCIPTGDKSRDSHERGRNRSHANPISALHNLTTALFSGNSPYGGEEEARYDHDDKLYGVDVVHRGRSRARARES